MSGVVGMEDFSSDLYKTIVKQGERRGKNKEEAEFTCIREWKP